MSNETLLQFFAASMSISYWVPRLSRDVGWGPCRRLCTPAYIVFIASHHNGIFRYSWRCCPKLACHSCVSLDAARATPTRRLTTCVQPTNKRTAPDIDDPEDDLCCPLWHVVHDDGDEEDLEEHEIVEAIRVTERVEMKRAKKTKKKRRRRKEMSPKSKETRNGSSPRSPSLASPKASKSLVGQCVSVYWEAEGQWFDGVVDDWDDGDDTALVRYNDGEQSWHDLNDFQWCTTKKRKSNLQNKKRDGADLIGSRVVVFWDRRTRKKGWFAGRIEEYNSKSERHLVFYDDKTTQWHDLKFSRWAFDNTATGQSKLSRRSKRRRNNHRGRVPLANHNGIAGRP